MSGAATIRTATVWTRYWSVLVFALPILVALGVQLWAGLQWNANLDSDEAVLGIMARDAMRGEIVPYMRGQNYLGTFEVLLAAGLMRLFGDSIVVFRLAAILLFGLFLVLHAMLVTRFWGGRVALVSLWIMALPSWRVLWWTYRPVGAFDAIFVVGTAALLVSVLPLNEGLGRWLRLIVLGFLIGLGLWIHPLTIVYVVVLAAAAVLASPEWAAAFAWLIDRRRLGPVAGQGLLVASALVCAALLVLAFFSGACGPALAPAIRFAKVALLVVGASVLGIGFFVSSRRATLLGGTTALAAGALVGNAPQWGSWLFAGIPPSFGALPSCARDIGPRAQLLLDELLPALWGIPRFTGLPAKPLPAAAAWMTAAAVVLLAFAFFIWRERRALASLLALRPLGGKELAAAAAFLLFAVPLALSLLGSNLVNVWSVRYILIAWPPSALVLALLFCRLLSRPGLRAVGAAAAGAWLLYMGVANIQQVAHDWRGRQRMFARESVEQLERHLAAHGASGGYADYWITYSVNLVSGGRVNFAQMNGLLNSGGFERCPRCTATSEAMGTRAYVLWAEGQPNNPGDIGQLKALLREQRSAGVAFPWIVDELDGRSVVDRRRVADWDVWIVSPRRA